jgi:hypothetical protein
VLKWNAESSELQKYDGERIRPLKENMSPAAPKSQERRLSSANEPLLAGVELEEWDDEAKTAAIPTTNSAASPELMDEKVQKDSAESSTRSSPNVAKTSAEGINPRSPASHERWSTSTSDDVPLLADTEETTNNGEEDQPPEATEGKDKKPLIKAEYKIAFSHFLVGT